MTGFYVKRNTELNWVNPVMYDVEKMAKDTLEILRSSLHFNIMHQRVKRNRFTRKMIDENNQ